MIRFLFVFLILFSYIFALDIAVVKRVTGDVSLKRGDKTVVVKPGNSLKEGDTLITKQESSVGFIFHDGTMLSLGENSILKINRYIFKPLDERFTLDVKLNKGQASFQSGKIGKLAPETVKFRVPDGIVGIRGTKFFVEVK